MAPSMGVPSIMSRPGLCVDGIIYTASTDGFMKQDDTQE